MTKRRSNAELSSREDLVALAARLDRVLRRSTEEHVVLSFREREVFESLAASVTDLIDRAEDADEIAPVSARTRVRRPRKSDVRSA
jgi:hypothetical protein